MARISSTNHYSSPESDIIRPKEGGQQIVLFVEWWIVGWRCVGFLMVAVGAVAFWLVRKKRWPVRLPVRLLSALAACAPCRVRRRDRDPCELPIRPTTKLRSRARPMFIHYVYGILFPGTQYGQTLEFLLRLEPCAFPCFP